MDETPQSIYVWIGPDATLSAIRTWQTSDRLESHVLDSESLFSSPLSFVWFQVKRDCLRGLIPLAPGLLLERRLVCNRSNPRAATKQSDLLRLGFVVFLPARCPCGGNLGGSLTTFCIVPVPSTPCVS